jgi:hypothetical protein
VHGILFQSNIEILQVIFLGLRITLPLGIIDVFNSIRQRGPFEPGDDKLSGLFLPWIAPIFQVIREAAFF